MARQVVRHVWGGREEPQGCRGAVGTLPSPYPLPGNTSVSAAYMPAADPGTPLGLSVSKPQIAELSLPRLPWG